MNGDCIPYQPIIPDEIVVGLLLFAILDDGDPKKNECVFTRNCVHGVVRLRTTLQETEIMLPPKIWLCFLETNVYCRKRFDRLATIQTVFRQKEKHCLLRSKLS